MNPIRKFYIKHPKFRRWFDRIDNLVNWANVTTYIIAFIILLMIIFKIYISLPEDIGATAATITGGLLSICVFPLITESINKRTEIQTNHYNQSHEFYENLSKHIITVLKTEDIDNAKKLSDYIKESYPDMCIDFPKKLIENLLYLKDECDLMFSLNINANADMDTIAYFGEKCINIIRKQGNIKGGFHFNYKLTRKESDNQS